MKINRSKLKGQWFDYDHNGEIIKIFIKPFSAFVLNLTPAQSSNQLGNDSVIKIIEHCIYDWENIADENGDKLECNKTNKLTVCESLPELFSFIMEKAQLLKEEILIKPEELKN
jgi:hypothetical protein